MGRGGGGVSGGRDMEGGKNILFSVPKCFANHYVTGIGVALV